MNLQLLRERFDVEAAASGLSTSTVERYRSWIRRFILYCRDSGISITEESAGSFLATYNSTHTRRQGYFALRFLFERVLSQRFAPEQLESFATKKKRMSQKANRRKWFGWGRG